MSKELVISANRHETRVAILEDDQVVEVYHQRENEYSLAGSIHKGRVTRVLPGMQSAFVDIGLDRDAFLYVSDFFEDNEEYDKIVTSVEEKVLKLDRTPAGMAVVAAAPPVAEPAPVLEAATVAEAAPVEEIATPPAPQPTAVAEPPAQPGGRRDDSRRDDDRRGRRGRRRRGGRDRRGLPDSKFYTPGAHTPEPERVPERQPEVMEPAAEVPAPAAQAEDFLVLPGESLAKYRGAETDNPEAEPETDGIELDAGPETDADWQAEAPEQESISEIAAEPAAEPQPELAQVAVEVEEEMAAPEPADEEAEEEEPAPQPIVEAAVVAETAEDVEPAPGDPAEAGESLIAGAPETVEAEAEPVEAEAESAEAEAESAGEAEAGQPAPETVEEEGPEPARIPTSLTATLREQGPRYLQHRVSRRTRRRGGREGREGGGREGNREGGRENRGPAPEGGRPQGPPPASVEAPRPQERSEQRTAAPPRPEPREREREKSADPSITDLLREGQEIIVQIAKEPLGQKGARITSHIALPGRFLVYMPTVDHIGVSRKIPSDEERLRLKRILQTNRTGIPGGFIVRTAGEGRTEEELRADMMFLYNLWLDMRQKAERKPAPAADPSRSERGGAHSARPAHLRVQEHLGG